MATIGQLEGLSTLLLESTKITKEGLTHLKDLKRLSVLMLSETDLEGATLEELSDKQRLQVLYLDDTGVGDEVLASVGKLPILKTVSVRGCPKITDKGLASLHGLEDLLTVNLERTSVTDEGIEALKKACPKVKVSK